MKRTAAGFILIEVIIAFIVIAVGTSALVQLHRGYLRQEANSGMREQAMHLAENKLDDLRTFKVVRTTAGKFAYQDIAANLGGTISAGVKTLGGGSFTLSWTVTNSTLLASGIPVTKDVAINVAWVDTQQQNRSLRLASTLSQQTSINLGKLSNLLTGGSNDSPAITYTPGTAPDVVAVTIKVGTKAETSKPLPTVYQSGTSTLVQFETITYDSNNPLKKIQEDQLTLACSCTLQGDGKYSLPAKPLQTDAGLFWATGASVTKKHGVPAGNQNSQSPYCTICCNNHFDGDSSDISDTISGFDLYYNQARQEHEHYSSATSNSAVGTGGQYLEACRLMRIDGFYQPMPDWNLVALNVMSPGFLTDSDNQQNYERYVKEVVINQYKSPNSAVSSLDDWLKISGNPSGGTATTDISVAAGTTNQLIARGIYVDKMSPAYLDILDALPSDEARLPWIPFNEVNLTLLADWSIGTGDQNNATVTNEAIQTIVDPDNDYYGTYSRGRMSALNSATDLLVTATVKNSNSGITSTPAISDDDKTLTSSMLKVTINSAGALHIRGGISCLTPTKKNSEVLQLCDKPDWNKLSVSATTGASCTLNAPFGSNSNIEGYFDCTVVRGSGVTISFSATGYQLSPPDITLSAAQTTTTENLIDLDYRNLLGPELFWPPLTTKKPCTMMMIADGYTGTARTCGPN